MGKVYRQQTNSEDNSSNVHVTLQISSANNKYGYFHAGPYIKIYNYLFKVITKKTPG
jgi:hypothetical protein